MFAKQYSKKVANVIAQKFQAHCDEEFDEFGSVPTLVELADEQEQIKQVIKRPMSYEAVRTQLLGSASVNTFDGFRLMVAKQVNLNSVSQHT